MSDISKINLKTTEYDVTDSAEGSLRDCGITVQEVANPNTLNRLSGLRLITDNGYYYGYIPIGSYHEYYLQLVRSGKIHPIPFSRYISSDFDNGGDVDVVSLGSGTTSTLTEDFYIQFCFSSSGQTRLRDNGLGDDIFMIGPETITMTVKEKTTSATGQLTFTLEPGSPSILPYPYDNGSYYILGDNPTFVAESGSVITDISGTLPASPKWRINGADSEGDFNSIPPFNSSICSDFVLQTIADPVLE